MNWEAIGALGEVLGRRGSLDDRFVHVLENLATPTLKTGLEMAEGTRGFDGGVAAG